MGVGNFIIVDRTKTNDTQIILGMPFLDDSVCSIDVKGGRIKFEVKGCSVMFCFIDKSPAFPNSSQSYAFPLSFDIDMEDGLNCQDPSNFDWISIEDPDQGYVKVEFTAPTPPSVPKVEGYAF